jgi:predicted dehydrogenase
MAMNLAEADAMIVKCRETGGRLFVVKQNRYNRPIQALKQALDAGRFGKAVLGTVRVRWCRDQKYYGSASWRGTKTWDGGVLTNQASHHIDLLQWLLGDAESVAAMTATRLANIETEDTAGALIRFKSGALGVVEATTATRPKDLEGSVSFLGEKGSVVVGGFAADKLVTWEFAERLPEDDTIFETSGQNPPEFAWNHTQYLKEVVEAIRIGRKAAVEDLEGRRSLELILAMYRAAETGREVSLPLQSANALA